jgi:predicted Zn-dependent peptidase
MSMPLERLQQIHREWLQESEIVFFYVGPLEPERVISMLRKRFSEFSPKEGYACPPTTVIRRADRVREVTEEMAVSQGKLNLGFRTGITVKDEDYYAMSVANEIFGASPVSKLFMEVREKQSLCYSIGSSYDLYKGMMKVSCGIDPDARDTACEAILQQWDRMCAGDITDEEIDEYIEKVKPLDRAGAYDIDEHGASIVNSHGGDYENIMGLPLGPLREWGVIA